LEDLKSGRPDDKSADGNPKAKYPNYQNISLEKEGDIRN